MRAASGGGHPRSTRSSRACRSKSWPQAISAARLGVNPAASRRERRHSTTGPDAGAGAASLVWCPVMSVLVIAAAWFLRGKGSRGASAKTRMTPNHAHGARGPAQQAGGILVIANRTCPCPALVDEVARRAGDAPTTVLV